MTEQEQIKEMAKEIEKAKKHIWASVMPQADDEDYLWHSRAIAEHLMLQGYRKLPEDSVVLSREEYERLKNSRNIRVVTKHEEDDYEICIPASDYDEMLKQECKETAEKILDLLVPDCKACDENWHSGCLCLRATLAEKIAKQFGLEVEK